MKWTNLALAALFFLSGCIPFVGLPKRESRPAYSPKPEGNVRSGSVQYGKASWYGDKEHGNTSASGEKFSRYSYTAAHKALPFGTIVRVTNLDNGKKVVVRINDRGPYVEGRVIDLSYAAAMSVGLIRSGVAKVKIEVLSTPSKRSHSLFVALYTVQAGSFSSRKNALALERKVSGIVDEDVRVESFVSGGNTYYRVRVGMFHRREDAENVRRTLRRRGYGASIYVE